LLNISFPYLFKSYNSSYVGITITYKARTLGTKQNLLASIKAQMTTPVCRVVQPQQQTLTSQQHIL